MGEFPSRLTLSVEKYQKTRVPMTGFVTCILMPLTLRSMDDGGGAFGNKHENNENQDENVLSGRRKSGLGGVME